MSAFPQSRPGDIEEAIETKTVPWRPIGYVLVCLFMFVMCITV
jgi:hypothetical protein